MDLVSGTTPYSDRETEWLGFPRGRTECLFWSGRSGVSWSACCSVLTVAAATLCPRRSTPTPKYRRSTGQWKGVLRQSRPIWKHIKLPRIKRKDQNDSDMKLIKASILMNLPCNWSSVQFWLCSSRINIPIVLINNVKKWTS